jgi:hypothetical protein
MCNRFASLLNYTPKPWIRPVDFRVEFLDIILHLILNSLDWVKSGEFAGKKIGVILIASKTDITYLEACPFALSC